MSSLSVQRVVVLSVSVCSHGLGDEAKPTCTGCKRRGDKCQWRMLGSFRDANIKVLEAEHPSMNQPVGARSRRQSRFKVSSDEY